MRWPSTKLSRNSFLQRSLSTHVRFVPLADIRSSAVMDNGERPASPKMKAKSLRVWHSEPRWIRESFARSIDPALVHEPGRAD